MSRLLLVSVIWAFAPGLIQWQRLSALDSTGGALLGAVRLVFALLVFAPLLRPRQIRLRDAVLLCATGAVQFGLMQTFYLSAFAHLKAHEVFLFTIFTPVYVALFDAALRRRMTWNWLGAAVLAAAGAGVLLWQRADWAGLLRGALLVQLSDICFAAGQVAYRWLRPRIRVTGSGQDATATGGEASLFGWLVAGGVAASAATAFFAGADFRRFTPDAAQWAVLAWLGVVSSGAGYFLWNSGATRVNAGTLAVFNNLKIPLGVLVSLTIFGTAAGDAWARLAVALPFFAAAIWWTRDRKTAPPRAA
ncbi:MAG: EamA family transporter [Puniceicoccales bacterium]|jgi:drug/metabolite transporter (DMT)-like permease|nr:EamA family transporter [Puniceicoccales bacterium]